MRIFNFARRDVDAPAMEDDLDERELAVLHDHALATRRDLLSDITGFLLENLLDVTPDNLVIAWHLFAGSEQRLSRRVAERRAAKEPITPEWFTGIGVEYGIVRDRKQELEELMKRLGEALTRFVATSGSAKTASSDYGAAIEEHARLAEACTHDLDPAAMAQLARAMLDRTRQVEADMAKSEREARNLRDSLQRARRDAELDYLTGLPNRRAFDHLYEREYREARAQIDFLSVAFCDIDNFKAINDTHGHPVGDRVIQAISEHFKRITGDNCHVARHGGEEFVLLFRGLTVAQAADRLDEARITFSRRRLVNRDTDEPIGVVTFSGGVADAFAYDTASTALKAADDALYDAKASGRNCIKLAKT